MLTRLQFLLLATLLALPVVVFAGVGLWALIKTGSYLWIWWTIPVSWGLAGLLYRLWKRRIEIPLPELQESFWTPRDRQAAAVIERMQNDVVRRTPEELTSPEFYVLASRQLATEVARIYHPSRTDPLDGVSVVEFLAAVRLASEDLEAWFRDNVPGSHLITIGQWRMLQHAPTWWNRAAAIGWVASIVWNPLNLTRYLASKLTTEPLARDVQQNVLGVFYLLYIRQLGYYLIELQSGRLRGGSQHYRNLLKRTEFPTTTSESAQSAEAQSQAAASMTKPAVTVALVGQVKAGKSSLINCLLKEEAAAVDVLPQTRAVQRYALKRPTGEHEVVLLDTTGYSDAGVTPAEREETRLAVRESDLAILVLDARSPARQADLAMLDDLADYFRRNPHLKPPPLIAVLNRVDGLSPAMEWAPPYDLTNPDRPKIRSILDACQYAREIFGNRAVAVVPVCADIARGRQWNVEGGLIPVMAEQLDEAHGGALLRLLHADVRREQWRLVLRQLRGAGRELLEGIQLGLERLSR
jgi:predicted GTPase